MNRTRDAFDPFAADDDESAPNFRNSSFNTKESDPWSSSTWPISAEFLNNSVDPTFDSGALEFSATSYSDIASDSFQGKANSESSFSFAAQRNSLDAIIAEEDGPTVHIAIHEQLSCVYDDVSQSPICQVEGAIHAQSELGDGKSFCLVLRDKRGYLERVEADNTVCHDISRSVAGKESKPLRRGDRILRVGLSNSHNTPIATYGCVTRLRPIPLLVKSRVQATERFCRVGVKVRSNPSNDSPLRDLAILLAVPPDILGETVRMSRQGGVWDGMKRTVTWSIEKLDPGEVLEVQAQFETVAGAKNGKDASGQQILKAPKFPVLVRCDTMNLFSAIEVIPDYSDGLSSRIKLDLTRSVRILHRKV